MNGGSWRTVLLVAAMLLVGAASWALQLRPRLALDVAPLRALPREVAGWEAVDVPIESMVESMLRADHNVQRAYRDTMGDVIWLYVGYYGTERGGQPEHTPDVCYPSQGWSIESRRVLAKGQEPRVNEYLVRNGEARELVHFWYRSHRRSGMLGGLDQTTDRLAGRLLEGRADGALVRISMRLGPVDEDEARSRLLGFAAAFDTQLAGHWPRETPADS